MKALRQNSLATAIQLSFLIALPMAASAQDAAPAAGEKAGQLDSVTVTGSRIKRVAQETASPVFAIDRTAIDNSGALTIGDFIQDTPSMAGAATNPSVNNGGGTGAATVSLRGLSDVRTLILINGRRIVTNDVNSIPMSMVERVEVLKDGASAIYGSDAVGGVVNFILKRHFDGVQVTADYGRSSRGDGKRKGLSSVLGLSGDRGNLMIGVNYNQQDEVSAAARKFSHDALTLYGGAVQVGGSSRTTTGRFRVPEALVSLDCNGSGGFTHVENGVVVPDQAGVTHKTGTPGTAISDFRCFTGADLFNYQAVGNVVLTPQERAGLFVSGNFDVTPGVNAYLDTFVNKTRSAGQIAPLPYDGRPGNDNVVISKNNIYNPFGIDITDSRLRLAALGNRRYDYTTDVSQFTAGLKGAFGQSSWTWDANVSYGKIRQDQTTSGYIQSSKLVDGLGPSFRDASGTPRCGTPTAIIANCTPLNFFGVPFDTSTPTGKSAQDALQAIAVNSNTHLGQTYRGFQANFAGDLFSLPAGTVQAAFGLEYRKTSLDFKPDALTRYEGTEFTCQISSEACASSTNGFIETKELYGELLIPLLVDRPFVKSLNMTLGTRFSRYNNFGSTTNSKLGIEYRPNSDLLLRSTYAQVFRAPTVTDLYGGLAAFSAGFTDPCNSYKGGPNPGCQFVPNNGSFHQSDTQLSAILGGTPTLKPEQGSVFTMGAVYDPSWLPNFSLTVDAWKVHLDDTIANYGTFTALQECFKSTIAAPSPFCSKFSRDPDGGEIVRLFDPQANVGKTDTKGIDLGFKYKMDTDWGKFRVSLDTTYVAQYDVTLIFDGKTTAVQHNAGTFLSSANGGLGNYSRWRGLGALNWSYGNFDAQWTSRYIHGFKVGSVTRTDVPCADKVPPPGSPGCELQFGATTYHAVQVGYKIEPLKAKLRVGVDNVFDKQPPVIYQNNTLNGNTDERTFDTVGRYYWTSLTFTF